jgi:uncharacterized repeat protein (TIGR04138 family)
MDNKDLRGQVETSAFPPEAFDFVAKALSFVLESLKNPRHISGRELVDGLCALAYQRYDYLAPMVLAEWGLVSPQDVGLIVFKMVDMGYMSRRPEDTMDDFELPFTLKQAIAEKSDHLDLIRHELKPPTCPKP